MKKIFSMMLLLCGFVALGATVLTVNADDDPSDPSFTLTFKSNSGTSDSTSAFTTSTALDTILENADESNVTALTGTDKVYLGKNGYGLKFGSASVNGYLTFALNQEYNIKKVVVNAATFNTDSSMASVGLSASADAAYTIDTALTGEFADFTYTLPATTASDVLRVGISGKRGYIKSVTVYYTTEAISTYAISFDAKGGVFADGVGATIEKEIGEEASVTLPTTTELTKTLYKYTTLVGWTDGENTYQPGKTVTVSETTIFSAVYSAPARALTLDEVAEIAAETGVMNTSIRFTAMGTVVSKNASNTNFTLKNEGSETEVIVYFGGGDSVLQVGDVALFTGPITTYRDAPEFNNGTTYKIVKPAAATSFEAEQTKASLKVTEDGVLSIRFGNAIAADSYNASATYGVVVSTSASDLENLTVDVINEYKQAGKAAQCTPVRVNAQGAEDANGDFYQFALVLNGVPSADFSLNVSAVMYMIYNGNVYTAEIKTASVQSVAAAYLEGDTSGFSDDLVEILQTLAQAQ